MNIKPNEGCKMALIDLKHYKFKYDKPGRTATVLTYIDAAGHSENVDVTKWSFVVIVIVVVMIIIIIIIICCCSYRLVT